MYKLPHRANPQQQSCCLYVCTWYGPKDRSKLTLLEPSWHAFCPAKMHAHRTRCVELYLAFPDSLGALCEACDESA